MYENGQILTEDFHFKDHIEHAVPIQIYYEQKHNDIGYVQKVCPHFVKVNNTFYSRYVYTFISRPGY